MPAPAACPEHDSLRAYALGDLSEERAAALEQHLEWCSSCLEVVQKESSRDPLARALTAPPGPGSPPAGTAEALLQRLKRLASAGPPGAAPTVSAEGTTPPVGGPVPGLPDLAA